MSQATTDRAAGATRRAQIEAALADYPHISDDRLASLIAWFRKEASAHDVAHRRQQQGDRRDPIAASAPITSIR
ncbi:MAG: hypothetical protein QM756_20465 [Polyangiaceae bacterium]